jgi:hypothetical protein
MVWIIPCLPFLHGKVVSRTKRSSCAKSAVKEQANKHDETKHDHLINSRHQKSVSQELFESSKSNKLVKGTQPHQGALKKL